MKAPEFWHDDSWPARALAPLGRAYALGGRIRRALAKPYKASVPVICVGNLTAGGAGKTPVTISLIRRLKERGVDVHAVTRGYGGQERGPHRVNLRSDTPRRVGDEPLLLAAECPTWVAKSRPAGIESAVQAGAELVILDDGHQNPSFDRDLALVVVDGPSGFGNGRLMPAGPLRETVAEGLARADAVVVMGEPRAGLMEQLANTPVLRAKTQPRFSGISLTGARVLAFAGIGRPEKFFETVRKLGAQVIDSEAFPDHHRYSQQMLGRLMDRAASQDLTLVTTEKDMVKLPDTARGKVWPVPIGVKWEDESALELFFEFPIQLQ